MNRNRIILLGIVAVVAVIALTFPLWSPYFINDVVDEAFPSLSAAERDAVRAMPGDEQAVYMAMSEQDEAMAATMVKAAMAEDVPMTDEMPAHPEALLEGAWIEIDPVHRAEGTATIYQLDEGTRTLRLEDFRVTNGPELHVLLARTTPTSIFAGVGEDYVDLGVLKGNVGNQNYDIPADVTLDDFQSVVIYCVPFGVVFSSAALTGV